MTINVKLIIRPKRSNYEIKNNKIVFYTSHSSFMPSKQKADLLVLVNNPENFKLDKRKVKVIATIPNTGKKNIRIKLEAKLPKEIHLLEIRPKYIDIKLR